MWIYRYMRWRDTYIHTITEKREGKWQRLARPEKLDWTIWDRIEDSWKQGLVQCTAEKSTQNCGLQNVCIFNFFYLYIFYILFKSIRNVGTCWLGTSGPFLGFLIYSWNLTCLEDLVFVLFLQHQLLKVFHVCSKMNLYWRNVISYLFCDLLWFWLHS